MSDEIKPSQRSTNQGAGREGVLPDPHDWHKLPSGEDRCSKCDCVRGLLFGGRTGYATYESGGGWGPILPPCRPKPPAQGEEEYAKPGDPIFKAFADADKAEIDYYGPAPSPGAGREGRCPFGCGPAEGMRHATLCPANPNKLPDYPDQPAAPPQSAPGVVILASGARYDRCVGSPYIDSGLTCLESGIDPANRCPYCFANGTAAPPQPALCIHCGSPESDWPTVGCRQGWGHAKLKRKPPAEPQSAGADGQTHRIDCGLLVGLTEVCTCRKAPPKPPAEPALGEAELRVVRAWIRWQAGYGDQLTEPDPGVRFREACRYACRAAAPHPEGKEESK